MHELEVPDPLAGLGVQADQRVREQVVAGAVPAVVVGHRRADRQVDRAELRVGAHVRPDVRPAGPFPRLVAPGLVAELARLRNRVEDPLHLAGAHVVAADVSWRRLLTAGAFRDRRADHDRVAGHERCRADRVLARVDDAAEPPREVDPPVPPEFGVRLAGLRIDGDQPGPPPGVEQAGLLAVRPPGEPPRQEAVHGGAAVQVEAGVVAPERLAGRRLDRRDLPQVGGGVEHAVDHQGRHLVGVGPEPPPVADDRVLRPQLLVDRRPGPRDTEPVDVVLRYLVQRRVLCMAGIAPVEAPLVRVGAGLGARLRRGRRHGGYEQHPGEETHGRPFIDPSHEQHLGCSDYRAHSMRTDAAGCVLPWSCGGHGSGSALQRERRQGAVRVETPLQKHLYRADPIKIRDQAPVYPASVSWGACLHRVRGAVATGGQGFRDSGAATPTPCW